MIQNDIVWPWGLLRRRMRRDAGAPGSAIAPSRTARRNQPPRSGIIPSA
ncbi:hypothetical protein [Paracoccus binzhouensis]|nr:hypothetical protein [Paracoccus binzhouensis]